MKQAVCMNQHCQLLVSCRQLLIHGKFQNGQYRPKKSSQVQIFFALARSSRNNNQTFYEEKKSHFTIPLKREKIEGKGQKITQ